MVFLQKACLADDTDCSQHWLCPQFYWRQLVAESLGWWHILCLMGVIWNQSATTLGILLFVNFSQYFSKYVLIERMYICFFFPLTSAFFSNNNLNLLAAFIAQIKYKYKLMARYVERGLGFERALTLCGVHNNSSNNFFLNSQCNSVFYPSLLLGCLG